MFEAEDRKTETLALVWVRENGHLGGYRYRTPSADQLEPDQKTKDKIWELFSQKEGTKKMIGSDGIERIAPSKRVLPFADLYEETVRQVVPNPIGHGYLTRSAG